MKSRKEVLIKLFISTLYLSAFTFGGGYVIVTLMKKKFVDEYHWIEENEMLDLVAIAQSAPGAIAVNGAIVVGYKLAGLVGALTAIVATVIPPFVIISLISVFYAAGVAQSRSLPSILIMILSFIAACVFQVNVIYIVLVCIGLGIVRTVLHSRKEAGGRKEAGK